MCSRLRSAEPPQPHILPKHRAMINRAYAGWRIASRVDYRRLSVASIIFFALSTSAAASDDLNVEGLKHLIDLSWIIVAAGLVLLMQAGFLCLESGLSRSKNGIHVAIKNLADFCLSFILFWSFGFAVMFGGVAVEYTSSQHASSSFEPAVASFFLFQAMFCGTSTTIVSGAVAERMKFGGYLIVAGIVSGIIYPVYGGWVWGGATGGQEGWLADLGFIDFAGATVVHSVGGWVALAALLVVGPRIGRYGPDARQINGHNLPLSMLGVLLLWFGWIGFNGGSTLEMSEAVPGIVLNTCLAAAAGGVVCIATTWILQQRVSVLDAMNGVIAGLVGITAGCHILSPGMSIVAGFSSAAVCYASSQYLNRRHIDDAIGAVSAHGFAGAWGTLCIAVLAPESLLNNGYSRWQQFLVQCLGVCIAFAFAFCTAYVLLRLVNAFYKLRIDRNSELLGLNVAEHGASTEHIDLLSEMQYQERTGDFGNPIPVEPNTEVGQIATGYNRVLAKFNDETRLLRQAKAETEALSQQLVNAAHDAGKAEIATDVLHNVGNVLNSVNVSANLVSERLVSSVPRRLSQTANLISENLANAGDFFAANSQGAKIPGFLEHVAGGLESDLAEAKTEMSRVTEQLVHIKAIVAAQQNNALHSSIEQTVDVIQLIDEAQTLNMSSFERHGIELIQCYEANLPELRTDKHKVLQILTNLLRNAKDSLLESRRSDRQLRVSVAVVHPAELVISVSDNGVGISAENLSKIFNHGFTTRCNGHGFGLHSCANAAVELGGSITASSDGLGSGATFQLKLPVAATVEKQNA